MVKSSVPNITMGSSRRMEAFSKAGGDVDVAPG